MFLYCNILLKKGILFLVLISCLIFQSISCYAQIKAGDTIPDIHLTYPNGDSVKLSDFKGKFLLVDFWASWCGPCRKAHKSLNKLHETYGDKNLQIIGISIDFHKTSWQSAIKKDQILYLQFLDPYGFDANSAIQFGVEALPSTYFFNQDGKLISINPSEKFIIAQLKNQ